MANAWQDLYNATVAHDRLIDETRKLDWAGNRASSLQSELHVAQTTNAPADRIRHLRRRWRYAQAQAEVQDSIVSGIAALVQDYEQVLAQGNYMIAP